MTFFQCGPLRLLIGTGEQGMGAGSGTIIYFRVPDIQAAHTALRGQGVAFLSDPHRVARMKDHDLWLAEFKDPSGNTLALMSEIARTDEGA
jgi:predicted enzyme related to lactoylglutathione lyase